MKLLNTTLGLLFAGAISLAAQTKESPATEDAVQIDGAKIGHWTMDFDAAKRIAAEKKLPLLVNFTGSDWCGWCKLMDKGVFAKDTWKKYAAENALLVTLDFPKDKTIVPERYVARNDELKTKFAVRGFPSYVILASDGETKIGQLGAGKEKTPESFISEFKAVVRLSPANVEAFVKANPDKAKAFKAAIKGVEDAKKELAVWLATKPERNEENTNKFKEFQESIQTAQDALGKF
ncbi:MAG: thioredoxin-related protein [Akkermansiaceae bacterium]|jgi:thioredoxin-related protein